MKQHWLGLGKLIEECGEVLQLAGKAIPYPIEDHPDEQGNVRLRFINEIGDLYAALDYFVSANHLPGNIIYAQRDMKYRKFVEWGLTGVVDPRDHAIHDALFTQGSDKIAELQQRIHDLEMILNAQGRGPGR